MAVSPVAARSNDQVEHHGMEFERTIDMADAIDEHGSWHAAVQTEAQDGTLLVFPPGEYPIDGYVSLFDLGTVGLVGAGNRGGVRFVAPDNLRGQWINVGDTSAFLWENIDW